MLRSSQSQPEPPATASTSKVPLKEREVQRAIRRVRLGLWSVAAGVSVIASACSAPQPDGPIEPAPPTVQRLRSALVVEVTPAGPAPGFQHQSEVSGLFLALMELGLADLGEVVPVVRGAPPSPGLREVVREGAERWEAQLLVSGETRKIQLGVRLCDAAGECREHLEVASRDDAWKAVDSLMDQVSIHLLREPGEEARRDWARPPSRDPYATLLSGRAAAAWYAGLLVPGMAQDPLARALKVDPAMGVAQWLHGRQLAAAGEWEAALAALQRGSVARPSSVLLQLDVATALLEAGRAESDRAEAGRVAAAVQAWEALHLAHPADPRIPLGRLRAMVAADRLVEAQGVLDALPEQTRGSAELLALQAAISRRAGDEAGQERALRLWLVADAAAEAPAAELLALLITQERDQEAWALLPDRLARAADPAALAPLKGALAVSVGAFAEAGEALEAQGRPREAVRARARADAEAGRALPAELAQDPSPRAMVALGRAALAAGAPEQAIGLARRAGAARPLPEALRLEIDALDVLGRHADAVAVGTALARLEPASVRALPQGSGG